MARMNDDGRSTARVLALAAGLPAGCGIPEPGIRSGAERLDRTVVCMPDGIGPIQNLAWLPDAKGDGELWIGGENGFVLASRDGEELERVRFARQVAIPRPIDVDGDGRWETMSCGEGWGAVGLPDADRRLVYHEGFPFPDIGAVAVPADDDGTGTEHLLVRAGTKVWRYALRPTRPSVGAK